MRPKLVIGLSLSLSGKYAAMGRGAEAALRLFVDDTNAAGGVSLGGKPHALALECHDDRSDRGRCLEIYRSLCFERRVDLLLGPYSSGLTRAAAAVAEEAGIVLVNHGGAADDLYEGGQRMTVGVLTSASEYMKGFVRLLGRLKLWRKRLAIVTAATPFARAVAAGLERACRERAARRRGVRVRLKYNGRFDAERTPSLLLPALRRNRVNAVVSAGSFAHDVAVVGMVAASNLNVPVLACVAAGLGRFVTAVGEEHAAGVVGPSQWEGQVRIVPELGPTPAEFARRMRAADPAVEVDYPAAQAYAAALISAAALARAGALEQRRLREAFADLRTSTFFGDFAIDRVTGRQVAHKMLLVQWHAGAKVIIDPEEHVEAGALEFPSGWRLLLASLGSLRLSRGAHGADEHED